MNDFQLQIPVDSGSLPDSNTAEAILYGSAYSEIKSILWTWDEISDYLERKAESLESQIMDREWCAEVMRRNPYLIYSRSPPVNEVEHLKDLFTLRQLCKAEAAIRRVEGYRQQNIAWARMKGIEEYVSSLGGRGISESDWKAATSDWNTQPITYAYVKGLAPGVDPDDDFDWNEAMKDLMGRKEYDRMVESIFGPDEDPWKEPEEFFTPNGHEEEETEDGPFEEDVEDDSDEDFEEDEPFEEDSEEDSEEWIVPFVEAMFDDPVSDVTVPPEDDPWAEISDWIYRSDIDGRGIVDMLIAYAEAARWSATSRSTRKQ